MIPGSRNYFAIGPASSAALVMLCVGLAASLRPGDWWMAWFGAPRNALGSAVFAVLMLFLAAALWWMERAIERSSRGSADTGTIIYGTSSVLLGLVPPGIAYFVLTHRDHGAGEGALGAAFIGLGILLLSAAVSGGIALSLGFAAWHGRHPVRWIGAVGLVLAVCNLTPLVSLVSRLLLWRLGG